MKFFPFLFRKIFISPHILQKANWKLFIIVIHYRIVNPLVFGDYPKVMKKNVGSRLPSFTKQDSELVKGATNFFGLNHYSSAYIEDYSSGPVPNHREFFSDMSVKFRGLIIVSKPSWIIMFNVYALTLHVVTFHWQPTIVATGWIFRLIGVIYIIHHWMFKTLKNIEIKFWGKLSILNIEACNVVHWAHLVLDLKIPGSALSWVSIWFEWLGSTNGGAHVNQPKVTARQSL